MSKMEFKKYTFIIALLIGISTITVSIEEESDSESNGFKTVFEPSLTLPNDTHQMIELKCSLALDEFVNENQTIEFVVEYKNNDKNITEKPDFRNKTYCYKVFGHTFQEWQSLFNITENSFILNCNAFIDSEIIGNGPSVANIVFFEGKEYGERCDSINPCNSNSNLVCNKICECKPNYIPIEIHGSYDHKCYPKVSHNENCSYDKQCEANDINSLCREINDNKTCQCFDYYIYDGIKCYSNSSWCDWFDYGWFSEHWIDIIVILIAFSFGLCLLSIVLSVSFYLRLKAQRAGNSPMAFKYPSSLTPKVIVSKYFYRHEAEDKKELTSHDSMNKDI